MLTSSLDLATYARDGIVEIALPAEVDALRRRSIEEMAHWLANVAGVHAAPDDLPAAIQSLAASDRALVGKLYRISRRLSSFRQLATHPALVELAASAMGTTLVSCCSFVNVRIDLPDEDRFLSPVHQDFPYIQGSLNGVTAWVPLFDTPGELGPPSWIPGSHRWGVQAVEEAEPDARDGSGVRAVRVVAEEEIAAAHEFVSRPVLAGTALLFSTLLVHRSERNTSALPRLNVQVRFDDALASESIERSYPDGLYAGEPFSASYPEYVR
jgi:ectoine hydroxylase-related dioxygenase (phytanoyl-CoA dioxygenase family)